MGSHLGKGSIPGTNEGILSHRAAEEEDANDCREVTGKMKKYCIGEGT